MYSRLHFVPSWSCIPVTGTSPELRLVTRERICTIALLSLFVLASVGSLAKTLHSFDHNENMYIVAGVLCARDLALYRDFAFLQMPYLPWLYCLVFRLIDTTHVLLIGKLFSFLFLQLGGFALYRIAYSISGRRLFSLMFPIIFLMNGTIGRAAGESSNYILPIAFSLLGFHFLTLALDSRSRPRLNAAAAGLCLAVAAGAKLFYAPAMLPFAATAWSARRADDPRWARWLVVPFLAALALGLAPVAYSFARSPEAFLFDNVSFHGLMAGWYEASGQSRPMSLFTKLSYSATVALNPGNLAIGVALATGIVLLRRQRGCATVGHWITTPVLTALSLLVVGALVVLVPTPMWVQYLATPISYALLALACVLAPIARTDPRTAYRIVGAVILVALVANGYDLATAARRLGDTARWSDSVIHDIAGQIPRNGGHAPLATLQPLFAVAARMPFFTELASGPFLFTVGDMLTAEQRRRFVASSPASVSELFDRDPPAALLVGFYAGRVDAAMEDWARRNRYAEAGTFQFFGYRPRLYVRGPGQKKG